MCLRSRVSSRSRSLSLLLLLACAACSTAKAAPREVAAAPPPKDDGKPAEGGQGGAEHSAALEQLRTAALVFRDDKQQSMRWKLPDGDNWTRVRFWGVPSLVGFRYGKDHHGIAGAFITHVPDNTVDGACGKSFEQWAVPWINLFEVELTHDAPVAFSWRNTQTPKAPPFILSADALLAKTATLAARDSYAAAWAAYPAWKNACLIVGVAIPSREDEGRAKIVRDRFAKDVFQTVEILSVEEPRERY